MDDVICDIGLGIGTVDATSAVAVIVGNDIIQDFWV